MLFSFFVLFFLDITDYTFYVTFVSKKDLQLKLVPAVIFSIGLPLSHFFHTFSVVFTGQCHSTLNYVPVNVFAPSLLLLLSFLQIQNSKPSAAVLI